MMVILRGTLTLLLAAVFFTTSKGDESKPEKYRLKGVIEPNLYEINIEPNLSNTGDDFDSFSGNITITATVTEDNISEFRIHIGCNIEITNDTLIVSQEDGDIEVTIMKDDGYGDCEANIRADEEGNDFYKISVVDPQSPLKKGSLSISLDYVGQFPPGMYGFYKSYYTDENGKKRVLLTTQFESTHARKAFPCFDEPGYKAQFDLTFVVPSKYHVISNTKEIPTIEEEEEVEEGKTHAVKFSRTTIMSTYLVAFIVYHTDTFSKVQDEKGIYATWGRKPEIDQGAGDLSQEYVPKLLESMADYTSISYFLKDTEMPNKPEKVDQAAIPDFSAGAMENWGLVTYRETALLYKAGQHSETAKKRVIEVIAHELAHQWFGNLLTTRWWNTAWLNEGFATLFEYHLTEDVTDGWRLMERFIADDQIKALGVDSYDSAVPMTVPEAKLLTSSQASNHFGTITYSKGGSILRMFENIVGPKRFQEAIRQYLRENAGKAVEPSLLFQVLDTNNTEIDLEDDRSLTQIFERWTTQNGFPLIKITRDVNGVGISQERFLIGEGNKSTKYDVKLTLSTDEETISKWLYSDVENVIVEIKGDKWVLVNTTGYFRVIYSTENWNLLVKELTETKRNASGIEPLERAVLVDNALNLARNGRLEYSIAIDVLNYLRHETDFIPWYTASIELNFLHRMLVNSEKDEGRTINEFISQIIEHVYRDLESERSDHISKVHHANIFNWACRVGYQACLKKVEEDFQKYITGESDIDPDIVNTVYCFGVKDNDAAWLQLWDKLAEEEDAITRSVIIAALGCSRNQLALSMYLEVGIIQGAIRAQDAPAVFSSVYSNPDGIDVALQFLERKITDVKQKIETVMNGLPNMINGIAQYLTTESQKERLSAVGEKEQSVKADVEKAVTTVETTIKWKEENEPKVIAALQQKMTGGAGTKQPAAIILTLTFIICVFLL